MAETGMRLGDGSDRYEGGRWLRQVLGWEVSETGMRVGGG